MGIIDDVKMMQQEGKSQDEIRAFLGQRGISEEDASRYISQASIKEAVIADDIPSPSTNAGFSSTQGDYSSSQGDYSSSNVQRGYDEMQPSILIPQQETQEVGDSQYVGVGKYAGYQQQQDYYLQGEQQYQPYQESLSSDVITEIVEQVVSERLSLLGDKLEKVIDFKTVAEAKISNLGERLLRIEQILDKLQISLLSKVGEYVQDVADMKKEIVETQKSFKAISHRHHQSTGQHGAQHSSRSSHQRYSDHTSKKSRP